MQSNFTWSKALGTASIYQAVSEFTVDDPYNLGEGYGRQGFDRKFTYNVFLIYQPPFFKGQSGPGTRAGRLDVRECVHCRVRHTDRGRVDHF